MIVMNYTDSFPWLKWSRHFTGETSVRVKIIELYNLLSTVLTVALYLGNDDFDTVKNCAGVVYEQLKQLKTIKHPLSGKEIKIVRRSCGDGKERRSSTGNSSAKSSYPIPEAPEHHSELGDMKLLWPCPVWSVEDTESLETKFKTEFSGKDKRREFAKQNLGNIGRKNICELHSLNTTLEHPTLGFDLQKHYACGLLKLHQVCIYDMDSSIIIDKMIFFF